MFSERFERVRRVMSEKGTDLLLVSVGPDLPWLTGYEAMPLERVTMLVVPKDGDAVLVVPELEAPRVNEVPEAFRLVPYRETQNPIELIADLAGPAGQVAISDRTWARFVIDLQAQFGPTARWRRGSSITGDLRARKTSGEIEALRLAAEAADRVAHQLQAGEIALIGQTEAQVSAEIGRRLIDEGHHRVNFAIVAAGENAASPHHEPSDRMIVAGDLVLCDFGGTYQHGGVGYCSDITRCVSLGEPAPDVSQAYQVLHRAQQDAVAAAVVGTPCEQVDAAARSVISAAGYGERFIHRTGHGIGVEEHEDPYIVAGNLDRLEPGHAFSIEPGIYTPGEWGMRLEDIVVATNSGPLSLNQADHRLVELEA